MPTFFGQLRSQLNPLLPRRRPLQKPLRSSCTEAARSERSPRPSRERRGELASSSRPAGWFGTELLPRPGGRERGREGAAGGGGSFSRRWRPDGAGAAAAADAVQRNERWGWSVAARGGGVGGRRARRGL